MHKYSLNYQSRVSIHKGIAMIELIFTIVILAITMLSVPMIVNNARQSSEITLQQESIAILTSHTNALLTYAWDEDNTDDFYGGQINILSTNSTIAVLNNRAALALPSGRKRTMNAGGPFNAHTNFGEAVDTNLTGGIEPFPDDLDDYANTNFGYKTIVDDGGGANFADEGEYIDDNISINTVITYANDQPSTTYLACNTGATGCAYSQPFEAANDAPVGTSRNVKRITTILSSENIQKNIRLKAFMCNIGTIKLESRSGL